MENLNISKFNEKILIPASQYIYRVRHRTMEGDCQYDHGPRVVKLNSYYIDKYPVTNSMFKLFMDDTGYKPQDEANFLKHWEDGSYPAKLENHPVVWVSPDDARAYATWAGGMLPKDTEWQYAACGPDKNIWPWGNDYMEGMCNSQGSETTAVDAYPGGKSAFGCMDMCANTWEWVDEVIDDGHHLFTLIRGGSCYKAQDRWHADGGPKRNDFHWKFQLLNEGLNRSEKIGFRCVKEALAK